MMRGRRAVAGLLLAVVAAGCTSTSTPSARPSSTTEPTVTGPVAGHVGEPLSAAAGAVPAGYAEQEFFVAGRATAYDAADQPTDGRWSVTPAATASYKTRIIVRRPTDPARFNGTVVVEWLNVSAGESSPDWGYLNPELADDGYAYVGVSAQSLGIEGGVSMLGSGRLPGLVGSDPRRYGSLHHPGDRYSYDMFAQIGRLLRTGAGRTVLAGLRPAHVVAVGESQSAFFLTTFADAIEPRTHAYDGIFIHSRGGGAAPLDGGSALGAATARGQLIRTDLTEPVFMFETETDVAQLGFASARQPDTPSVHTWEVAGTSHADAYVLGGLANFLKCGKPVNDGPQHVVAQAAFAAFVRWVVSGVSPPGARPLVLQSGDPVRLARDANGNARGGVRTPAVDVPVAALSGVPNAHGGPLCLLFGSTSAFPRAQLLRLYGDRAAYLARYRASLARAIRGGFIRAADRGELLTKARAVKFG